ncbi:MAG: hypothetical protein HY204_06325 [Nitrospirae bacterium]|nr:hypothetical protein [Nitrospirota bacterium]
MALEQMTLLEKRVHQILDLVKRLREDNALLDQKVKTIGQKLAQRERDRLRWKQDRIRLRSKLQRMLSEMETLSARPDHERPRDKDGARPRKRGDA